MDMKQYDYQLAFDKPIQYKELNIYPITIKDYYNFFGTIGILTFEKNKIPDLKVLSMSYIEFVYHLMTEDERKEIYQSMFFYILSKSFDVDYNQINIGYYDGKITLSINGNYYDKNDFEQIRKIICHRNMPDYSEEYIDPDLEEEIKKLEKIKNKNSKEFLLESQIECLMIATGMPTEKLENISIRKLIRLLRLYDAKMHYEIYRTGEASGMVTYKNEIEHWFYTSSPDRLQNVLMGYEDVKNKINI